MTVLEVENLKKIYRPRFGGNQVQALSKVTFLSRRGRICSNHGREWLGEDDITEHAGSSWINQLKGKFIWMENRYQQSVRRICPSSGEIILGLYFSDFNLSDTFNLKGTISYCHWYCRELITGKMNVRMMPIVKELGIAGLLEKYPY